MASTADFNKLNELHKAITDLDKIIASESPEKIDQAFTAIKMINKSDFSDDDKNYIILAFRKAILKLYVDQDKAIKDEIFKESEEIHSNIKE